MASPDSAVSPAVAVFPPRRDVDVLRWSTQFATSIAASPAVYGLTPAQAATYTALHGEYATAYRAARTPTTNSRAAIIAKDEARERLLRGAGGAWELVRLIDAQPATTDTMRGELGLRLRDNGPTPVAAPASPPHLAILWTNGRRIRIRLRDVDHPEKRGKPPGVEGAVVLYHHVHRPITVLIPDCPP